MLLISKWHFMRKLSYISGLLLFFSPFLCFASDVISRTFLPSVEILGGSAEAVEIRSKQQIYSAFYDEGAQSFYPLNINFDIISVYGDELDYRLTLPLSVHECESNELEVSVALDHKLWPAEGLEFYGKDNEHQMTLSFSPVPQLEVNAQSCFGTLIVQVEAVRL